MKNNFYEIAVCHQVAVKKRGSSSLMYNHSLKSCISTNETILVDDNIAIVVLPLEVEAETRYKLEFKECVNREHIELSKKSLNKAIPSIKPNINPTYGLSVIFKDLENLENAKQILKERIKYAVSHCKSEHIIHKNELLLNLVDKVQVK